MLCCSAFPADATTLMLQYTGPRCDVWGATAPAPGINKGDWNTGQLACDEAKAASKHNKLIVGGMYGGIGAGVSLTAFALCLYTGKCGSAALAARLRRMSGKVKPSNIVDPADAELRAMSPALDAVSQQAEARIATGIENLLPADLPRSVSRIRRSLADDGLLFGRDASSDAGEPTIERRQVFYVKKIWA